VGAEQSRRRCKPADVLALPCGARLALPRNRVFVCWSSLCPRLRKKYRIDTVALKGLLEAFLELVAFGVHGALGGWSGTHPVPMLHAIHRVWNPYIYIYISLSVVAGTTDSVSYRGPPNTLFPTRWAGCPQDPDTGAGSGYKRNRVAFPEGPGAPCGREAGAEVEVEDALVTALGVVGLLVRHRASDDSIWRWVRNVCEK